MLELKPMEIVAMLFFGGLAGMLASMAVMVWGTALWLVIGEGRSSWPRHQSQTHTIESD